MAGRCRTRPTRSASSTKCRRENSRASCCGARTPMVKCSSLSKKISDAIRERGPMTVAAFMELALYDPAFGYFARAAQRTGRAGDFFTSVDVGAIFGRLIEIQLAEMWTLLGRGSVDLVEAGAGNGRLSADILRAAKQRDRAFYDNLRLHLVEASPAA